MDYKTVASVSISFILLCLHHRNLYFTGYILAGAQEPLESSLWSHYFSIAYAVKFFGPSGSLAVENKPNKVGTQFFRFSAVSHVPARRAISPAANSLSLRALAGCHRSQSAAISGCLMGKFNGGCTAADGCRDSHAWRQRSSRLTLGISGSAQRRPLRAVVGRHASADHERIPARLNNSTIILRYRAFISSISTWVVMYVRSCAAVSPRCLTSSIVLGVARPRTTVWSPLM